MFRPRWWQLTHRHPKRLPRRGRLAAGASLHRPLRIEALEYRLAPATHTWTGAADTLWSNNANWMEGAPTSAEMNIVLVFPAVSGPSTSSANDISGLTVQSITFTGSGYTISGSAITLTGGINSAASTMGTDTVNFDITLGAAQTWGAYNAAFTLAVGGTVSGAAAATLTFQAGGSLVIAGNNTFAGDVKLDTGTVTVGSNTSLGTGTLILEGGRLRGSGALANAFFVATSISYVSGNLTMSGSGTLALGATLVVPNSDGVTTTFSGVLSGAGGLKLINPTGDPARTGKVILNAADTYTGPTSVDAGTLQQGVVNAVPAGTTVLLASGAALDLNNLNATIGSLGGGQVAGGIVTLGSATLTLGGDNSLTFYFGSISGTGGLVKAGTNTLTLRGSNTYTGPTVVAAGTLVVDGMQPASNVTVNSGATLGGTGTVGTITVAGTISPGGPGSGILHSGNVMFNPGSSFFVGLGELIVNGTVNLNGATLSGTAGLNLGGGWMIIILSPGGLTGTFNGLPDGALFETSFGNQFVRVNYLNGVTLSATQPVPNVVLTASANPSLAGLPVTFTFGATAPISGAATPSGLVTFTDGLSTLGIAYLNPSGIATLTTASLSPGTHTIAAAYSGDTRFAFASANLIQTVINLIPTITNLSQTLLPEGSQALVLTVLGSSFIPNSIVRLNSGPLTTAFVSSTQLQATIPAAALIDEATFTVTVFNPGLGGGASNGLTVGVGESPLPDGTRGTPNQRAVAELYGDLLGRTADAAGLAGWSGLLDRNGTVAQVVAGITGSLEYRTNLVQGLYRQYLQRAADSSGLATGLAFLQSGGRVEQLAAFITGSQEYFQIRVGGSNDGFLAALYHDVLNRDIDSSGQISFGQALVSGTSRSQVASAIFGSDEYRGDLVQSFYQRFLDRSTDSGGLSNWLGVLKNGATDEQVIAGLIGSAEYFNKTAP